MKRIILSLLLLVASNIFAQSKLSQTKFDLGEISRTNEDVVDLVLANYGSEDLYILRIEAPEPLTTKYTSKTIRQNSSTTLRFKLNPKDKGRISEKVLIHFSDATTPTTIELTANVKTPPKNNRQECPSFNKADMAQKRADAYAQNRPAKIKRYHVHVGDAAKEQPLLSNKVSEKEESASTYSNTTAIPSIEEQRKDFGKSKTTPKETPRHTDSAPKKERQTPEERRNSPSLLDKLFGDPEGVKGTAENNPEVKTESLDELPIQNKTQEKENSPAPVQNTADETLLTDNYRPNNIVFLIDASYSMTKEGRMDLLKATMVKLLTPLRSIDSLSIVTYSGDARILIAPTSGFEKDKIAEAINNITPEGSTQAAKGLSTAIDVGLSSFIASGNNQIVLATDGDFDIGSANTRLREKITNAAKKGLTTSVVGIRQEKGSGKSLREIKNLGEGEMLKIKLESQTASVLEMIKKQSSSK